MATRSLISPSQMSSHLGLSDQTPPVRAETISIGKSHADYLEEGEPDLGYFPHEVAGIQEGPDVLIDHVFTGQPSFSILDIEHPLRLIRRRAVFNPYRNSPYFYFVLFDEYTGVRHQIKPNRSVMRWCKYTRRLLDTANMDGQGRTPKTPYVRFVGGPWVRPECIIFGIDMLAGHDPRNWFREKNADEFIPMCLTLKARTSVQCMVLALEFLMICTIFDFGPAYQDLGLYIVRKELNCWNVELLLTYLVGDPIRWDAAPFIPEWGTIFEPMAGAVANVANLNVSNLYQVLTAEMSLLATIADFFNNNIPPLGFMPNPTVCSPALGAIPLDRDGPLRWDWQIGEEGTLPPAPPELKEYKQQITTFRIASIFRGNPPPEHLVLQNEILPMLYQSMPYGILKFILYSMTNMELRKRFEFAHQICLWRALRIGQWIRKHEATTGRSILWKRRHWTYEPSREVSLATLPGRYRWMEAPFLLQQTDGQGRVSYIFDLKRYWYEWQEYEGEEAEAKKRDSEENDFWFKNKHRVNLPLVRRPPRPSTRGSALQAARRALASGQPQQEPLDQVSLPYWTPMPR